MTQTLLPALLYHTCFQFREWHRDEGFKALFGQVHAGGHQGCGLPKESVDAKMLLNYPRWERKSCCIYSSSISH
jgi:hypothetical protein